jgi:hypothetical protein
VSWTVGGEESTIKFMESQSVVSSSSVPLLHEAYAYGNVEHQFPLNCLCIWQWFLSSSVYMEKGNLSGHMRE